MITHLILLLLSVKVSQAHFSNFANNTYVINMRTGIIHPPSVSIIVQPGDQILLCTPPGMSHACHSFMGGTCFTLHNGCVAKTINQMLRVGTTLLLSTSSPKLRRNKLQPHLDPVPHCLILSRRNRSGKYFEHCVRSLDSFRNATIDRQQNSDATGQTSVDLKAIVQVATRHQPNHIAQYNVFIGQVVFLLLTVPLFLLKSDIY